MSLICINASHMYTAKCTFVVYAPEPTMDPPITQKPPVAPKPAHLHTRSYSEAEGEAGSPQNTPVMMKKTVNVHAARQNSSSMFQLGKNKHA